jgi:hypothetical protein
MTLEELDAIEARANAASDGPWEAEFSDEESPVLTGIGVKDGYHEICQTDYGVYGPAMKDAEFIAAARTDVPALVAEVRRLRDLMCGDCLREVGP